MIFFRSTILLISIFWTLLVTNTFSQSRTTTLGDGDVVVYDLAIQNEKGWLASSQPTKVQVWDIQSNNLLTTFTSSDMLVIEFRNNFLAGVSKHGEITVWDVSSTKEIIVAKISDSPLISLAWIDSLSLVAGSDLGEIIKFNLQTKAIDKIIKVKDPVTSIATAQPGETLLIGNSKGNISLLHSDDLTTIETQKAHRGWVRKIKVSDDSKSFVSAGDDGKIIKWSLGRNFSPYEKRRVRSWITGLDYGTSGNNRSIIASAALNGLVEITSAVAKYKVRIKPIPNSIVLLRNHLPQLEVAVATHGQGVKLISAKNMELGK